MTAADPDNIQLGAQLGQWQRKALMVGAAGVLVAIAGFLLEGWAQFLRSYFFAYLFWTGMALGCLGILLLHHTVGGKWGMLLRRLCEAGARLVPYMIIGLIPVLLSLPTLYPWDRPEALHDPVIQHKVAWLNVPGMVGRSIFYFVVWTFYAYRLSKLSWQQDETGEPSLIDRMRALSAPGLVVFTFVTTGAFIDWIMALEPHWFSTMYGIMFLVGQVLESFAFTIALVILLSARAPLKNYVTKQHFHDLGNMMFAFMVLWAYLSFSQFLITWAGNLPNEIPWYLNRLRGGWGWVALTLVIFHFATPFVLLLMRGTKRHPQRLLKVCMLMIVVRIIDVYWIVEPAFYGQKIQIHWLDFVTPLAIGGLWVAGFFWQLRSHPLVPLRDPNLQGAPRETVAF
jgi:hypothetical protein